VSSWWDVLIVGGGPAGSIAAYHLARAGARVVVAEAKRFPRHKTCGGGIVGRALRECPVDLGGIAHVDCRRAALHLVDADWSTTIEREEPIVRMASRRDLDESLLRAAADAGAAVRMPARVSSLRRLDPGFEVEAGRERLRARFVVGADGAAGIVRRLGGWSRPLPRVPALEWELRGRADVHDDVARFFFGLGDHGYAWIFPKRRGLSIGALSLHRDAHGVRRQLERLAEREGVDVHSIERRDGYVIPTTFREEKAHRGDVLLVGDAAGLADPITWEGIGPAMASGRIAAEAITTVAPERVAQRYAEDLRQELLEDLRRARWLARLVYGDARRRRRLFALCGDRLAEAMTDVVTGRRRYRDVLRSPRTVAGVARSAVGEAMRRLVPRPPSRPSSPEDTSSARLSSR
jgi:geranylgeranyl reductase family protein